jgi:predicted ribosomally synthesized peptide with SipW-like signal peptide
MTRIRRGLLLMALTVGLVLVGSAGPALASFSDASSISLGTISTADVTAPRNVVGSLTCGSPNATMSLTWQSSTSTRVSGYLVTVRFSDGFTQTVQKAATDTSWSASITLFNVTAYSVQYSVTTQTDYGWTEQSAFTGSFKC